MTLMVLTPRQQRYGLADRTTQRASEQGFIRKLFGKRGAASRVEKFPADQQHPPEQDSIHSHSFDIHDDKSTSGLQSVLLAVSIHKSALIHCFRISLLTRAG
jgi:hypothetical protein